MLQQHATWVSQDHQAPADFIFLVLFENAELRSGQVAGLAEVPDLLLDKHEPLKAEESVVLVGVPGVHMLVELACTSSVASAASTVAAEHVVNVCNQSKL